MILKDSHRNTFLQAVSIDFCDSAYVFEEAAANLAEVRLLLVELLFQAFQELPLESVDLLNIAKDSAKLLFGEHVCSLAALFDVTLKEAKKIINTLKTFVAQNRLQIVFAYR